MAAAAPTSSASGHVLGGEMRGAGDPKGGEERLTNRPMRPALPAYSALQSDPRQNWTGMLIGKCQDGGRVQAWKFILESDQKPMGKESDRLQSKSHHTLDSALQTGKRRCLFCKTHRSFSSCNSKANCIQADGLQQQFLAGGPAGMS